MTLSLSNDLIDLAITPERGADLTRLTHKPTGIQVFAESPTGDITNNRANWGNSLNTWISGYPGGWQLLVPNAGAEREWDGVTQGYHGEASLATWSVIAQDDVSCELHTTLLTAPLSLRRRVEICGPRVTVTDHITNLSPRPIQFRLCHHPAFGENFLDDASYLETTAALFIADADKPGSLANANTIGVPSQTLPPGPHHQAIRLPGPHSGESLLGALAEFVPDNDGDSRVGVTYVSPNKGLSARLCWDGAVFPYAWVWIEANATKSWPWFQRMYAIAIEPSNVLPGAGGAPGGYQRGGPGTTLAAGRTLSTDVSITLAHHSADLPPSRTGHNK